MTGYPHDFVAARLAALKSHIPKLVHVRTDRASSSAPLAFTIHTDSGGKFTLRVADGAEPHPETVAQFCRYTRLPEHRFEAVLNELRELAKANENGSWIVDPQPVADAQSVPLPDTHAFLLDVIEDLAELMPLARSVEVVTRGDSRRQGGSVKMRRCLRVLSRSGNELCALDTAHFATTLQGILQGIPASHREENIYRAQVWAKQLGVAFADMPQVLHDLKLITADLTVDKVKLAELEAA